MKNKMLIVIAAFFSLNLHARLAPTTLESFVGDAELIVEVAPTKLERTPDSRSGAATLSVLRVWAGKFEPKEIQVAWGNEIHDQPITDLDRDYLLFLKKDNDGKFVGAQYGRSYWPIAGGRVTDVTKADLDSDQRWFSQEHPIQMVTLTSKQKKTLIKKGEKTDKAPRIGVKALREFIAKQKSGT